MTENFYRRLRPIRPTEDAKVKIEKWSSSHSEYTAKSPWKVLTRYPGEAGFSLVGSFTSWENAIYWALH